METKYVLIIWAIIFLQSRQTDTKPVFRFIHGLGMICSEDDFMMDFFPDFDIKCIESSKGYLVDFKKQIRTACESLNSEIETLKNGYSLLGFSQGGLVARAILQDCEAGKYVRKFITFGSPHNGVALVPNTEVSNILNWTVIKLCFFKPFQWLVGPCSYIRSNRNFRMYKHSGNVLSKLNNEFSFVQQYKDRMSQLEVFMAVNFKSDRTVRPITSALFGFYDGDSYDKYLPMEEMSVYKEDRLGLVGLQTRGCLFRCSVEGDHLQFKDEDLISFVVNVAKEGNGPKEISQDPRVIEKCVFSSH